MHNWKRDGACIIIDGTPYFVNTPNVASIIMLAHKTDIAELQAKLDAVMAMLKPNDSRDWDPDGPYREYKEAHEQNEAKRKLYPQALAIARGNVQEREDAHI